MNKDEMFKKYEKVPAFIANKYHYLCKAFNYEQEDFVQSLRLELYVIIDKYDDEKGKFLTFACTCLDRYVINFFSKKSIKNRQNEVMGEDFQMGSINNQDKNLYLSQAWKRLDLLKKREKGIVKMHIMGYTNRDIAREYKLSGERIRTILEEIRETVHVNESRSTKKIKTQV